ncbi:Putative SOS response-associated peptidase YedK [Ascidiaceihabitans donghaensis]|uniref:Abasic site processing protein n=1 Tax=Ascidiaceihabitans donghaensis TaxID=1510460 RepID=A0A2R8BGQ5_9RHOB|nr:SOS response-associated peptidase [Ascidiaceihabitans donghaensis]SPH22247.1 Putative SOS response-associated peptidase YedK [Ascidiaceihabitans donghaensis]
MCGRFAITLPNDAMAQLFAAAPSNDLPDVPNFNVCPTTLVHVITSQMEQRRLEAMRWGLIPNWYKNPNEGPLLINARGETIADKPAFRTACRERRGIIVATGFYEWTKGADGARDPWYITRRDEAPLMFAAVWQDWAGADTAAPIRTCAAVTVAANVAMSAVHHRMPVVLEQNQVPKWLGEQGKGAATLMRAAPEDTLRWHRVDRAVNSNRASGAQLIEPLSA